jgi:uncharacterized protein
MEPTDPERRQLPLDVLRGLALLGMLLISVRWFSLPAEQVLTPRFAEATPAQRWVWGLGALLLEGKVIAVFCVLFGAGIGLGAGKGLARQLWRQVLLIGLGAVHAFGLWYGDVLMLFGVLGLVLAALRRLPTVALLCLGVLSFLAPVVVRVEAPARAGLVGEPISARGFEADKQAAFARLFAEEQAARGTLTWSERARWRARVVRWWPFGERADPLRCGGFMLLGLALFKLGFLTGGTRRRTYAMVAGAGLMLGLTLTTLGLWPQLQAGLGRPPGPEAEALGWAARYLGAGPLALGWVAVVLLLCSSRVCLSMAKPLAAVGRMSLSGYLLASLVCVGIYQWGGPWASHDPLQQLLVAVAIGGALLALCPLWLAHFRFGPAEWCLRCLTYLRVVPMRVRSEP